MPVIRQVAVPRVERERLVQRLDAEETNGPSVPPEVPLNIRTQVRFRYIPGTTAPFTPRDLLVQVPGNAPAIPATDAPRYWYRVRLLKVSLYSTATLGGNVSITYNNDPKTFTRSSVPGVNAGALHTIPPFMTRQNWFDYTDTSTVIFNVPVSSGEPIIHITVDLLSKVDT